MEPGGGHVYLLGGKMKQPEPLPIDVIPGFYPARFKWQQTVDTISGRRTLDCEGNLPVGVEAAVVKLIEITRALEADLEEARDAIRKQEAAEEAYDLRARGINANKQGSPKKGK